MKEIFDTIFIAIASIIIIIALLEFIDAARIYEFQPEKAADYRWRGFALFVSGGILLYLNRINMNLKEISNKFDIKIKK